MLVDSNAGVYQDGDVCTAIEVLNIFMEAAEKHRDKLFKLYLNDINQESIDSMKKVVLFVKNRKIPNLKVFINCEDVNGYLQKFVTNSNVFGYGKATILYIDPYDFGTVQIPKIKSILENNYCELIFNFFISDYIRNIKKDTDRIKHCIGNTNLETKDDIINYMQEQLRIGKIKYLFSYQFRTKTNVELYQIIFATPNIRGLEKLKEVLWKVFDGKEFHRNYNETGQMSLFAPKEETEYRLNQYVNEAKILLCDFVTEKQVSYEEIEIYLIENTMLASSQIIKNVIKPLINSGKIIKMGRTSSKNNYKHDFYMIGKVK